MAISPRLCAPIAAFLLAGCAVSPAPVAPLLSLEGNGCVPTPDLVNAQSVPAPGPDSKPIDVFVDGSCLAPDHEPRRGYAVFRLPAQPGPYLVDITSVPRGSTLLPPVVRILDEAGKETGRIERDTFTFHGPTLYAGLRAYPGDRYLVVESDPKIIGRGVSQIAEALQTNTYNAGRGYLEVHTGSESTTSLVFAHNGLLSVGTRKIPSAG